MPTTKIARERKRMTPVSGRNLVSPQCELAAGIALDHEDYLSTQPPLYCSEYYNRNRNTLLN